MSTDTNSPSKKRTLPGPKFQEAVEKISCDLISEGKNVRGLVRIDGKQYVSTGGSGTGHGGWETVSLAEVVPISQYRGKLMPLNYQQYHKAARAGKSEGQYKGYKGQIIRHLYIDFVCVRETQTYYCAEEGKQQELF